ncbi:MAG: type II toxin-antitoxin system VapC family toxin [Anaerolineae bacterium]|nr:type II toxin-antitoxin system VapC family toxin [Anaerolineae bacterium]
MTEVGIDTSVIIGLLDPRDIWHEAACDLEATLVEKRASIVIFDCVLAEAVSTMARRIHEQRRGDDLDSLLTRVFSDYPQQDIHWILPDVPNLYTDILGLVGTSGGELNFNDALIALECRESGIPFIASFDRDFDTIDWLKRLAKPEDFAF